MKKYILIALVVLLAAGGWWFFGPSEEAEPQILETATVDRGPVRKVLEATGIIKAEVGAQVKIGARATGTIEEMRVRVGDPVQKGDLIAVIDDRELMAQMDEARARLERTQAELRRVQTVFPLQIDEAEAELDAAQARLEFTKLRAGRQKALVDEDLQAREELDSAVQDLRVAQNDVAARRATLARVKREFIKERIKAERAVVEAQASIDSLEVRISYTTIISPMTGVVAQVTAQEGETVVSGLQVSNLITVLDPTRLEMWIYVDETDVGQVAPGQPVEFTVDAYPGRVFRGTVDQIYPQPEIRDNIVYYQALVDVPTSESDALRPEMTTQCRVIVTELPDVMRIPTAALKWVGDKRVVFVQQGETARRVTPELGLAGYEYVEVTAGLEPDQQVGIRVTLPGSDTGGRSGGRGR